jgi:hypothetical protein
LADFYSERSDESIPQQYPLDLTDPFQYQRRISAIVRVGHDHPLGGGQIPSVLVPSTHPAAPAREAEADARVDDGVLWAAMPRAIPGSERKQGPLAGGPGKNVHLISLKAGETCTAEAGSLVLLRLNGTNAAVALRATLGTLREDVLLGIAEAGLLGEVRAYRLLAAVIEELFQADERRAPGTGRRQPIVIALPFIDDDLRLATVAGSLLIDGIGDAIYLPAAKNPRRLSFTILQAVKARVTRADYVACPSCGRTQFDLMEVTAHIKAVTDHLDGVTIAIMGCIVNGPGEMADADFGYVGSGPGKIDLYRRKDLVRRNLPFAQARDELIQLIKDAGMWKDPVASEAP